MTPPKIRHACAVCGRVLDYFEGADGTEGWRHGMAAPEEDDHIAVPVPADEIQVRGRCDFCYADEAAWRLPAREVRFEIPGFMGGGMDADWAACDGCAKLIERNQWNGVYRRFEESWVARHGSIPDQIAVEVKRLWRLLRANITGPLRPL